MTILAIDDDPMLIRFLDRALNRFQCKLVSAGLATSGITLFREQYASINAVILDLSLEDQPWAETIRILKEVDPAVRIVISSGSLTSDSQPEELGIFSILPKPFSLDDLVALIEKLKS